MHEFSPKPKKIKEKIIMSISLLLGAVSYGVGTLLPYPALYQLFTVFCLTVAVLITVRYLLRDYIYRVIPKDDGTLDLTVTEIMGKKRTVVCRVLVEDIKAIIPLAAIPRKELSKKYKGKPLYRYVSELQPQEAYLLEIFDERMPYYLEISADKTLIALLKFDEKQYLSDL